MREHLMNHVELLTKELAGLRKTINTLPADDARRSELEESFQALSNVVAVIKADLIPTAGS
jgi:hypothetical protein